MLICSECKKREGLLAELREYLARAKMRISELEADNRKLKEGIDTSWWMEQVDMWAKKLFRIEQERDQAMEENKRLHLDPQERAMMNETMAMLENDLNLARAEGAALRKSMETILEEARMKGGDVSTAGRDSFRGVWLVAHGALASSPQAAGFLERLEEAEAESKRAHEWADNTVGQIWQVIGGMESWDVGAHVADCVKDSFDRMLEAEARVDAQAEEIERLRGVIDQKSRDIEDNGREIERLKRELSAMTQDRNDRIELIKGHCHFEEKIRPEYESLKLGEMKARNEALRAINRAEIAERALREAYRLLAEWRPAGWVDHACICCVPNGEIVKEGFLCAYHKAQKAIPPAPEGGGA